MELEIRRNNNLKERARELRKNMTKAEKRLWYDVLCKDQLLGLRFLRQRIIDNFIADFYCSSLRLVIELDGASHLSQYDYDRERDEVFNSMGIIVLRLPNDLVLGNLEGARNVIIEKCQELAKGQH